MGARPRTINVEEDRNFISASEEHIFEDSSFSEGSTSSLLSILDQNDDNVANNSDSSESSDDSIHEDSFAMRIKKTRRELKDEIEFIRRSSSRESQSYREMSSGGNSSSHCSPDCPIANFIGKPQSVRKHSMDNNPSSLSPWEQWLIKKMELQKLKTDDDKTAAHPVEQIKVKPLEEKDLTEWKEKKQQHFIRHKKDTEQIINDWLSKKKMAEKQQKMSEKLQAALEFDCKKREDEKKKEVAAKKYEAWLRKKADEKRRLAELKKMKAEQEARLLSDRKAKSEKAFNEWCAKHESEFKKKRDQSSFGYLSGKLTGYYDRSSNPVPSFCNPIPWQHPYVPPTIHSVAHKITKRKGNDGGGLSDRSRRRSRTTVRRTIVSKR